VDGVRGKHCDRVGKWGTKGGGMKWRDVDCKFINWTNRDKDQGIGGKNKKIKSDGAGGELVDEALS